jgi:hypothetical protein
MSSLFFIELIFSARSTGQSAGQLDMHWQRKNVHRQFMN